MRVLIADDRGHTGTDLPVLRAVARLAGHKLGG